MKYKIGLIGLGNMASALIEGWVNCKRDSSDIIGFDIKQDRAKLIGERFGINIGSDIQETVGSELVILAVKPQDFTSIKVDIPKETTIVSIMAGIPIKKLEEVFPNNPIIRVMPNLLCGINKSFIPFTCNDKVDKTRKEMFILWFSDFGEVTEVKESLMNVMTAINGSGPGFVAYLIEAFSEASVFEGLPYEVALKLTLSIFEGTSAFLRKNNISPNSFRLNVTSPGGTTSRGIWALEKSGIKGTIYDMLRLSSERARELENS
ncbi:MAG: pyrroline-5-carboxylate reductase [bacterium]|nr:pyrroline-5-carboxylate reductase [bacterium]